MAKLIPITYIEVAEHLLTAGFMGWEIRTMGAICMAESGRIPHNHGLNDTYPTSISYLSEDHGLFMINDYWGPQILSLDLMEPFLNLEASFSMLAKDTAWNCKAAREMFQLRALQQGYSKGFTCWSAFNNNKHLPFMKDAYDAAHAVGAI